MLDKLYIIFLLLLFIKLAYSQEELLIHKSRDKTNFLGSIKLENNYFIFYQDSTFFDKRIKCKVFSLKDKDLVNEFYLTPNVSTFQEGLKFINVSNRLIFLAWVDFRDDQAGDIYAQLIDDKGILWDSNAVPVCQEKQAQKNISVNFDTLNNIFLVWEDFRKDVNGNIYVQKIDLFGRPYWEIGGIPVTILDEKEFNPKVVPDNFGGCYITWIERTAGINKLYIQRIDSSGNKNFIEYGLFISRPDADCMNHYPVLDQKNELLIFYASQQQQSKIYFQKISPKGAKKIEKYGRELSKKDFDEILLSIQKISNEFAYIYLSKNESGTNDLFFQILNQNQKQKFRIPIKIHSNCDFVQLPQLKTERNGFLIYWTCDHLKSNKVSLFMQTISFDGKILKENGLKIIDEEYDFNSTFEISLDNPVECIAFNQRGKREITFLSIPVIIAKNPEVTNFDVIFYEGQIKINWELIDEKPGTKLFLERSEDGKNWTTIYSYVSDSFYRSNMMSYDEKYLGTGNVKFRIRYFELEGNEYLTDEKEINSPGIQNGFYLFQNSPNPFESKTVITFQVPIKTKVILKLYNSRLEEIATLLEGIFEAGTHEYEFIPLPQMTGGIYFYKFSAGGFYDVKKMIYTK